MSKQTLEDVIEERVFLKLSARLQQVESNTKKQLNESIFNKLDTKLQEVESNTKKEINDLRNDTHAKIKRLSSSDKSVAWKYFGSDSLVTNTPSNDDPSIFRLSQDLYSLLATASWRSAPFWISILVIFGFQFSLLILLLANQVDANSDNPLNLPANVETPVRISQVLLIIIALFSQDDLLVGIESLVDDFPDIFRGNMRFSNVTKRQWRLSSILRLCQGLLNLLAAFVLSIQSETVPDVLLNVLGVGFVSNLDNLFFGLSMKGYFGGSMKRMSEDLCDVRFHRTTNSQNSSSGLGTKVKKDAHIIIAFTLLLSGIVVFGIFAAQQEIGMYSEQDIRIEFGDEVLPFLGLFNGCYQASDSKSSSGRLVYEQVGYPNGGKFVFCSDFGGESDAGWAFFIGKQQDDMCKKHKYIVRSGDTSTFSLLEAGKTDWYTSDDLPLDSLEITEIKTSTSECGQSMFSSSRVSCPSVLAFDSMTMSRLPVSDVMKSGKSLDASVSHAIYYNSELVDQAGRFELIFFSGRRWIRTRSDHFRALVGNESILEDFFVNDGLFSLVDHLKASAHGKPLQWVSSISESVDTSRDQGSPLGLQWYFPRYEDVDGTAEDKNLQRNFPSADLARPIDSSLTCLYCNTESNPCLHEGVCDNDSGICNCKHGTSGKLCRVLPLGNGICNLYFNRAEYNYDGGDCCAGTCIGESCGEDDLPNPFLTNEWKHMNTTDEWKDAFRGREFAFGVDVVSDELTYDSLLPLRYGHCKDPHTALLIIKQEGRQLHFGTSVSGTSVRCDGTLYLRTPDFLVPLAETELINRTFEEKIRVPYGADCLLTIEENFFIPSDFNNVSLLAENQSVPFLEQQVSLVESNIRLRIPDSACVWNTFLENLVSVFIDFQEDGLPSGQSLNWNDYLSADDYTNFTNSVQLGSICNKDPDEMLERYALWVISKSIPRDLSHNFVGHSCDAPWNNDQDMFVVCSGRRVSELTLHNSNFLPSEIGRLTLLTSVDLSGNEWTSLPSEIGKLTSVSSLDLSDNQLTSLPAEIERLVSVSSVDLRNNNMTSFPSEIEQFTLLTSLSLSGNQLNSLPSEIGRLTSLSSLDLSSNQLTSLPSEIGRLTSLEKIRVGDIPLDLSDNNLTSLPSEIGQLASLPYLDLRDNQLTSLPPEIGRLTSLTTLDVSVNQLTSLPSELASLIWLENLLLQRNRLTSLPTEIGSLALLEFLFLDQNQLTSLPSEIGNLSSLRRLNLFFNPLTVNSLPLEISNLTSLEVFVCGDDGGYGCGTSDGNSHCTDSVGWLDFYGRGCDIYELFGCTPAFPNADGISAKDACCICGGGAQTNG